ncbi:MAG: hypothetical protein PQJ61_01730 [Spirochaetales bacterium]|uniref:Tetratricopeptide repeat protein n=1 Tax=Candidatus Thalassospirochaeta sargassi TaxID=3119039 RepID=A0AAJ1IDM2_9SPIO|nr:hypothetical protein [Spirochaetales bacterium]
MIKKNIFLIFLFSVCFVAASFAAQGTELEKEYYLILDSWINNESGLDAMLGKISGFETELGEKSDDREVLYWQSRASFLKAQVYYDQKEKKLSIKELEECLDSAKKANEIRTGGDILGVMAEANSLLMLLEDFFYIVANYKLPTQQARSALDLDPDNSKASFVLAQFLCNAPPIAGGDLQEGLDILLKLSRRQDLRDSDRFFALQSLAEVYKDNKRLSEALDACLRALELYPMNMKCRKLLSELKQENYLK